MCSLNVVLGELELELGHVSTHVGMLGYADRVEVELGWKVHDRAGSNQLR